MYSIWNDFIFLLFLEMVIFTTLFWHWRTLWNSPLKITTLFQRWIILFFSTLKFTLFIIVNSNSEIYNIFSTLLWHCIVLQHNISQKTMLKQRGNVCWVIFETSAQYMTKGRLYVFYLWKLLRLTYITILFVK